jgi:hypothetical protein
MGDIDTGLDFSDFMLIDDVKQAAFPSARTCLFFPTEFLTLSSKSLAYNHIKDITFDRAPPSKNIWQVMSLAAS